jgi:ribosomal protein L12E/L44/L45/RPP1/RPP2
VVVVDEMDVETTLEQDIRERCEEEEKASQQCPSNGTSSSKLDDNKGMDQNGEKEEEEEEEEEVDDFDPMDTSNYPSHFPLFHI